MSLIESLLIDPFGSNIWINNRRDFQQGDGTASNPFNGGLSFGPERSIVLTRNANEASANSGLVEHGFLEDEMVRISGVTGPAADQWNRVFGIYDRTPTTFKFAQGTPFGAPEGLPLASRVTFLFDKLMREVVLPFTHVTLGPGIYQTRGYAPHGVNSWQPKEGQKLVGSGIDVTTLQLVGAGVVKVNNILIEQHYHTIGMNLDSEGVVPAARIDELEIRDLTIDCNLEGQPLRGQGAFTSVACGAIRVFGSHCRIRRVKAINWGTKSLKQGAFVYSLIAASAETNDADNEPVVQETTASGIEDCVAIQPVISSVREVTLFHIGGRKNPSNKAQAFGVAPFIRRNFADCQFVTPDAATYPSAIITGAATTRIEGGVGKFIGKRPHNRTSPGFLRFNNPLNPKSFWNGYFFAQQTSPPDPYSLNVTLDLSVPDGESDSSLVILGSEFRGIGVTSGMAAVVEENHIINCWIGGPYSSPLDDSVSNPSVPPNLAREERLDPLNALNTRSLVVSRNSYKNVAAGPYWNMGGVSGAVSGNAISYDSGSGLVTITTAKEHKLWINARVQIAFGSPQSDYDGLREITAVTDTTFQYQTSPGLAVDPSGSPTYRVVSGVDFLTIEGNIIELADLDSTEFAIKEYPLPANPAAQTYRPFGIIVADNGLSTLAGPYAHRQVTIWNNKIRYLNGNLEPTVEGLGYPAGAAMQLTGIKQLHVTHNVIHVNPTPASRTYRCGMVRFFHNNRPDGELRRGWKGDTNGFYDEPEALVEDAFVMSMLQRRNG